MIIISSVLTARAMEAEVGVCDCQRSPLHFKYIPKIDCCVNCSIHNHYKNSATVKQDTVCVCMVLFQSEEPPFSTAYLGSTRAITEKKS